MQALPLRCTECHLRVSYTTEGVPCAPPGLTSPQHRSRSTQPRAIRHALLQLIMHGWLWQAQVDLGVTRGRSRGIVYLHSLICFVLAVQVAHYSRSIRSFFLCLCWSLFSHAITLLVPATDVSQHHIAHTTEAIVIMHFTKTVAACALALITFTSASPLPTFNDIERRWSEGESEVCLPLLPACYMHDWLHDLFRRVRSQSLLQTRATIANTIHQASIHANINIREATPAWPVEHGAEADIFSASLDKRTQDRARVLYPREEETTITAIRAYVAKLFQEHGTTGLIEARHTSEREDAPVLRPRMAKYSWAA